MKTAAFSASASGYRKEQYMLNVGKIEEGFVLDHIKAGNAMKIYHYLGLDKLDCTVAIIKNARSNAMGKKDILKVECDINTLNLDVLAFIDRSITINVIKSGQIVEKRKVSLPKEIRGIIRCQQMRRRKSTAAGTATSGMKPMIRANYKTLPSGSPHRKTRRPFSLKFIIMSAVRETFRFSSPSSSRRTNFAAASSFSSIRMSSPSCASQ